MGHVRTDIRYLLHLGRTTLGLVIGKISKRRVSKKICLGEATQKRLAAMGNTRTSFPGMPKPGTRQSIVRAPTQITHK